MEGGNLVMIIFLKYGKNLYNDEYMNLNIRKTFTVTSQPYYDQYCQCYKNILMVNFEPEGPLRKHIRRLKLPRLSPFNRSGPCNPIQNCGLAIISFRIGLANGFFYDQSVCNNKMGCELMTPDEIPDLISFLQNNGYLIETQVTNMLNQGELRFTNQKLAFTATYYGDNPPNIVYMK